jgi:hypothetical protein
LRLLVGIFLFFDTGGVFDDGAELCVRRIAELAARFRVGPFSTSLEELGGRVDFDTGFFAAVFRGILAMGSTGGGLVAVYNNFSVVVCVFEGRFLVEVRTDDEEVPWSFAKNDAI